MVVALSGTVVAVALGTGAVAGVLIGSIGVGGIVVVPVLLELPGMEVDEAVATAMLAYVAAGAVGTVMYARQPQAVIDWRSTATMCVAAAPTAFAGSWALTEIEAGTVKLVLYALMLCSSAFSLAQTFRQRTAEGAGPEAAEMEALDSDGEVDGEAVKPEAPAAVSAAAAALELAVGAVTGFGSALTGTSGPVILLPILIILGWEIHHALGNAQTIQIPIALAATAGNLLLSEGATNFALAGVLCCTLCPAIVAGNLVARRVPAVALKRFVAVLLVVCSVVLVARLALS